MSEHKVSDLQASMLAKGTETDLQLYIVVFLR